MGFKCGIIGLPNVGKSTLFNALTKANTETANFPFCTIKPNIGVAPVPDIRLDQLATIVKPHKILPAIIEFIDIAGLVKGSSKGEGLGNQFLANIRETEAIGHVVRCFDDNNIIHLTGNINPIIDVETINTELILADINTCKHAIHHVYKKIKDKNNTEKNIILDILTKCLEHLENIAMLRSLGLTKKEKDAVSYLNFLTLKPTMYIANISKNGINDTCLDAIRSIAKKDRSMIIPICAINEIDVTKSRKNKHNKIISKFNIEESSLNKLIYTGYKLLNLQTYFTVGVKEIRAWTIPVGTTSLQAAGKIHSDFVKGFIRAQTIAFADFIYYNGWRGAREAGKMRSEGKNYIVQDGDIINFLFNL